MTRELLLQKICPNACKNSCAYIGCGHCNVILNELLDEYDKHVIEQYKADTNLKDTIVEGKRGINISDDICEWKQDNMRETVYRVCGGFSTNAYQTDFEFCPYCGKKIKVVGD